MALLALRTVWLNTGWVKRHYMPSSGHRENMTPSKNVCFLICLSVFLRSLRLVIQNFTFTYRQPEKSTGNSLITIAQ